jgi:hypothetical protein
MIFPDVISIVFRYTSLLPLVYTRFYLLRLGKHAQTQEVFSHTYSNLDHNVVTPAECEHKRNKQLNNYENKTVQ